MPTRGAGYRDTPRSIKTVRVRSQLGISVVRTDAFPHPPIAAVTSRRRKKLLSAFTSAFRTPDLRKKLLFTVFIIALYRLGATLPSPGVSYTNVRRCLDIVNSSNADGGVLNLLNLFSGGALLQLSVFALGIMPYIT